MYGLSNGMIPMTVNEAEGHLCCLNLCDAYNSGNSMV